VISSGLVWHKWWWRATREGREEGRNERKHTHNTKQQRAWKGQASKQLK
jgi:hypothetical protein